MRIATEARHKRFAAGLFVPVSDAGQMPTQHTARSVARIRKEIAAVESISVLEAARQLGRSKNTVKYWVRKLPPETVSKDEKGRLWISSAGLELLRDQLKAAPDEPDEYNHQEPDERTAHFSGEPPRTGRKPPKNHPQPDEKPDEKPLSTGRKPDENHLEPDEEPPTTTQRTTAAQQLDALRKQLDDLRADLSDARQAAAVATAERDAERRRADAAELREQQHAQTVTDLTAALQSEQQHAAELTALLQTANEQLTAALALNAGQIQLAMQQGDTAAQAAAVTAEPADGQPGDDQSDTGSARTPDEHRDTAADQQTDTKTGDGAGDQSTGKRRGFFARLFGKR